mgnify:CR=1 FL=1
MVVQGGPLSGDGKDVFGRDDGFEGDVCGRQAVDEGFCVFKDSPGPLGIVPGNDLYAYDAGPQQRRAHFL